MQGLVKGWSRAGVTTCQFRMGPVASLKVLCLSLIESTLEVLVFLCPIDRVIRRPSSCLGQKTPEETLGIVTQREADKTTEGRVQTPLIIKRGKCTSTHCGAVPIDQVYAYSSPARHR